ncbi:MAG: hypothetical protein SVR94_11475 [Pseudomonadota bacterium]|nr:hypothetical protein [Pseudomonadota bacterium]
MQEPKFTITSEMLKLIAEVDEFKGKWHAFKNLSPERLTMRRKVATVESLVGWAKAKRCPPFLLP